MTLRWQSVCIDAHDPAGLLQQVTKTARNVKGNTTPELTASDLSGGDSAGGSCPTGYCHLGGPAISDSDAYGAGLIDLGQAVR